MDENTIVDSSFFRFDIFVLLFFLLSAFLYSKPFSNNLMLCEIIDRHFNLFFVEIQHKKENLKVFFGHQCLDPQTRIPVS